MVLELLLLTETRLERTLVQEIYKFFLESSSLFELNEIDLGIGIF